MDLTSNVDRKGKKKTQSLLRIGVSQDLSRVSEDWKRLSDLPSPVSPLWPPQGSTEPSTSLPTGDSYDILRSPIEDAYMLESPGVSDTNSLWKQAESSWNNAPSKQSDFEIDWLRFGNESLTSPLDSSLDPQKLVLDDAYGSPLEDFPGASNDSMVFTQSLVVELEATMLSENMEIPSSIPRLKGSSSPRGAPTYQASKPSKRSLQSSSTTKSSSSSRNKRRPSKTSTSPEAETKASNHNFVEKQYRERLNLQFDNLMELLPKTEGRTGKADVLVQAKSYISQLEENCRLLEESNLGLQGNVEFLKRKWLELGAVTMPFEEISGQVDDL
ncbi:hypothetical protein B0J14DRAFT_646482 [Halenospora varia]|nr:hypothetical protein B0J14DRAFT_646482 [Halenospora varia]